MAVTYLGENKNISWNTSWEYLGLAEKVTQKEHKDELTNEVVLNNKLFSRSFTHRLLFLILHPPKVASAPN